MKKLCLFLLIGLGCFLAGINQANAEAYDISHKDFIPSTEANLEAIERVKNLNGLENVPIPLENLTIEQPAQSSLNNSNILLRRSLRKYRASSYREIHGMYQWKINELAPVGFSWLDNGIPQYVTSGYGQSLSFISNRITDTGVGGWQYGYYWRQFSCAKGTFWASVWDKTDLLY